MMRKYINNYGLSIFLSLVVITMPLKSNINSMSIILLLVFSIYCLFNNRKEVQFKFSKSLLILVVPFLFILIQGIYSDWDSFSKNALRSLPILLFPFLFFYLKPWLKPKVVKCVLKSTVYSAVGYSLLLLATAIYRQFKFNPDFSNINYYFFTYYDFTEVLDIHPTYLGMYICMAFAIVFHQVLKRESRLILNVLLLSFLGLIVFLSGSRISLLCLILITFIFLIVQFKSLDRAKKFVLIFFITLLPLLIFNFVPIVKERMIDMTFGLKESYEYAKYGDKGKDNNYFGGLGPRLKIWDCAVSVGNRNYFFGSGFGTTQTRLNACYISKGMESFAEQDYQTHSQYFNHYSRGGFIGLLVLILFYFYSLFFAVKRKHLLHISLITILIIASLTENILNRHMGIVFFAFFNSLFFFSLNKDEL